MIINVGSYLGPYEIISKLNSGGMGEIYQAIDKRLDREVAIKVLPNLFSKDIQALARFKQEMKSLAALSHINILTIYEFDKHQDIYFAATELLKGETLRSCINRGILDWKQALEISIQIAEGLSAAHSKKIVHRDIKPENIFITLEGCVKILDFGLAKIEKTPLIASQDIPPNDPFSETVDLDNHSIHFAEEYEHELLDETTIITGDNKVANTPVNIYVKYLEESRNSASQKNRSDKSLEKPKINPDDLTTNTQPGAIMGTIPYMSPEQLQGKNVDVRSDIFSFGNVLYEMLTGTRPFYRTTVANTATAILVDDPPKINKEINKELDPVVLNLFHHRKPKKYKKKFLLAKPLIQ